MAIYHLSVKTVSRSAGRSATAAAAYRAGVAITDERTGEHHDYTRKGGVVSADLVLPESAPAWAADRSALWNAAEQSEKRKNSTVAREFEIALPAELDAEQRRALALDFAGELVKRHGCAADVAVHEGGRGGDERNHHAHILLTTRRLGPDGFGEKTRELDDQKTGKVLVTEWRERFADLQNDRLRAAGHSVQVDHRTLAAQGIEREPTRHLGPTATAIERRTGEPSQKRARWDTEAQARLEAAAALGADLRSADKAVLGADTDLRAALREREQVQGGQRQGVAAAVAAMREQSRRDHAEMRAARELAAAKELAQARAEIEGRGKAVDAKKEGEQRTPEPVRWVRPSKRAAAAQEATKAAAPVLSPTDAVKQWDAERAGLAKQYQGRADRLRSRLQGQIESIGERRWQERQQHAATRPEEPRGLLAGFKMAGYQAALGAWKARDNELMQQGVKRQEALKKRFKRLEGWSSVGAPAMKAEQVMTKRLPERAKLVELGRAELAAAAQAKARQGRDVEKFQSIAAKRRLNAGGWSDSGKNWQALPASLRRMVEDFNQQPQAVQAVVLDKMRTDRAAGENLHKLLDTQSRSQGWSR